MFDIGFTEIVIIGLVALIVIGPNRLPGAMRTTALWIGRAKRMMGNVRRDLENEIGIDEIRQDLRNEQIMDDLRMNPLGDAQPSQANQTQQPNQAEMTHLNAPTSAATDEQQPQNSHAADTPQPEKKDPSA